MHGRRRFGRRGEQGQVIPIVALLVIILTGFAAISLDAGMDYAQLRNDNDISDAAALAGSYWVTDNQSSTTGASLASLYLAEYNAATSDGCNTGQCQAPMVVVGSSAYKLADLWTTTAFTAGSGPAIYVNSAGACSTTASGTFSAATCPAVSAIKDVGAPVSDHTSDYFAAVVGGHPVGIIPNAVAAVGGSGGGGTVSANPQLACEVCVLQNVTFGSSSGSTLQTSGGNLDIGGYVNASNSGTDTIQTYSGYGIEVVGATQYDSSTVYFNDSSGASVTSAGTIGINHNVLNAGGGNVTLTGARLPSVEATPILGMGPSARAPLQGLARRPPSPTRTPLPPPRCRASPAPHQFGRRPPRAVAPAVRPSPPACTRRSPTTAQGE